MDHEIGSKCCNGAWIPVCPLQRRDRRLKALCDFAHETHEVGARQRLRAVLLPPQSLAAYPFRAGGYRRLTGHAIPI